jgi:hypothetical protein
VLKGALLICVEGEVQRTGLAVSLLVRNAQPLLPLLESEAARPTDHKAQQTVQGKLQRAFF